ncbi:MAG TPA: glycosyltransferase [Longimicrobiales bacterium]|nr:glycosyltransferase [Longimicrobiales bacterium]
MLKIVQIAAPTAAGGLERVVEALAIGHHARGHEVIVATLVFEDESGHPFVRLLRDAGVRVEPIRLTPRAYVRERRMIADLCRRLRPDVVHTHGYRIDLLDRGVVAGLGIPTVTTVHGASKTGGLKGAAFEWLQRRNYRRFDAVVAVSKALHATTLADGVRPDRLHLIPNAWASHREPLPREDARAALELPHDAAVVGWVGRLIPVKGADVFLRALARVDEPRLIGALVGYGPEEPRLHRLAEELDLGERLRFYPSIRDAARYFPAFDTYVLSSRSEGLPIVILEAMSAATPIVAARVGGVPDALGDDDAWLVPPEDPAALASAIEESLRDRPGALERARRAQQRLREGFSLEAFLDGYERVYEQVVGAAGRAPVSHPGRKL